MKLKKTRAPARSAKCPKISQSEPKLDEDFLSQYDEDYWHSIAGGERREKKKKLKMRVSGKSVFKIKEIIEKKSGVK